MPNSCCVDRKLPLALIPDRHRAKTRAAIDRHDAAQRNASEARARAAEAAREEGRRQLHNRLGARKVVELQEAMQRERRALQSLREPPGGLGLDLDRANRARKRRMDAVVRRLGADPKVLRVIGAAAAERIAAGLGVPAGTVTPGFNLPANYGRWTKLSELHAHPLDWGVRPPLAPADPDRFDVFGPDFPLWNLAFDRVESDNFRVVREFTLFEHAGAIGNVAKMDCNDAGSFDFAHAVVDTEVVFIYEAKRSGRLEVIVDAMNTFGHHDLAIEDEWGWSEHWTRQHNYVSLNVFHPAVAERSLALMSQFDAAGNEDRTWSVRALTPGTHYYAHLMSNGAVQAGDTFFVGVGTRTFDITRANDVEVHSRSSFQWLIRSVEVRVVP